MACTCLQQVLGGLHGHLGSGQAGEVTTALEVLLSLTHSHTSLLLQHAAFLSTLLDCLDNFTQPQLHQVTVPTYIVSDLSSLCPGTLLFSASVINQPTIAYMAHAVSSRSSHRHW